MEIQIAWIFGLIGSLIIVAISIIINRWFRLTDKMSERIEALENKCNIINNDINVLRIGVVKDLEQLGKSMEHLGNAIEKLTDRLEKTEAKHSL